MTGKLQFPPEITATLAKLASWQENENAVRGARMSDFYVGQEVVCVDDVVHDEWLAPGVHYREWDAPLRRGCHYTISETGSCLNGRPGVQIAEVRERIGNMFDGRRFRPIKSESIAIFRQMCVSPKPLVPVE